MSFTTPADCDCDNLPPPPLPPPGILGDMRESLDNFVKLLPERTCAKCSPGFREHSDDMFVANQLKDSEVVVAEVKKSMTSGYHSINKQNALITLSGMFILCIV